MSHWTEKYIGRKYIKGQYDCADLALEVLQNEFNKVIDLPTERVDTWTGLSKLIDQNKLFYGVPTDDPQEGDACLMVTRGRLNHIGIVAQINTTLWVLHNMANVGEVCLHKVRDLKKFNLEIEGFYKFKRSDE